LTLGVEFELALLDPKTLLPSHNAAIVINELKCGQIKKELFEHMVEVTSVVGKTVHEVEAQFKFALDKLIPACEKLGVLITGTGRPPTIKLADARRVPDERYARLNDARKILNERFGTLGMHIHIGMASPDQCIRYHNFFMHFVPHFIALSASAPFEDGMDTGLATIRPTIAESLPVAGMPYNFHNWQEYVNLCRAIFRAGSIENLKDLWWDLRPSPSLGTLEIRVCDQPSSLSEGLAITAFVHGLAHWFHEHQDWLDEIPRPNVWRLRENKWRAMRYGLKADLVTNNQGDTRAIAQDIEVWMERIMPYVEQFNYGPYMDTLHNMLTRGNSSERQQRLWESTKSLEAIAHFNCDEFMAQKPLWDRIEALDNQALKKSA
jgi:carboxylate-amine ligase